MIFLQQNKEVLWIPYLIKKIFLFASQISDMYQILAEPNEILRIN